MPLGFTDCLAVSFSILIKMHCTSLFYLNDIFSDLMSRKFYCLCREKNKELQQFKFG